MSNREVIDSTNPRYEQAYIKFTGEELTPVGKNRGPTWVQLDEEKIYKEIEKRSNQKEFRDSDVYYDVHTHPDGEALPTKQDIDNLVGNTIPNIKRKYQQRAPKRYVSVIATRDGDGTLAGYTMMFQRRRPFSKKLHQQVAEHEIQMGKRKEDFKKHEKENMVTLQPENPGEEPMILKPVFGMSGYDNYMNIKKRLVDEKFDIRFYPAKGFYLDKSSYRYRRSDHSLERILTASIVSFGMMLLLSWIPITGAAIFGLSSSRYGLGGIGLIMLSFSFVIYFMINMKKRDSDKDGLVEKTEDERIMDVLVKDKERHERENKGKGGGYSVEQVQFKDADDFIKKQNNFWGYFDNGIDSRFKRAHYPVYKRFETEYPDLAKSLIEKVAEAKNHEPRKPLPKEELYDAYNIMSKMIKSNDLHLESYNGKPDDRFLLR